MNRLISCSKIKELFLTHFKPLNLIRPLTHYRNMSDRNQQGPQPPIIAVIGATATGKSDLAIALAERFNGEVISSDSMQVYRGLDIVSNKVDRESMSRVKHHLIDFLDPLERFSVVDFQKAAIPLIHDSLAKGTLPIITGGTFYYLESVIWDMLITDNEDADDVLLLKKEGNLLERMGPFESESLSKETIFRDKIIPERFDHVPVEPLYQILKEVDEKTAMFVHPNDKRRVIRYLQAYQQNGVPYSQSITEQREKAGGSSYGGPLRFDNCIIIYLYADHEKLCERINKRVDQMIDQGLLKELEEFHAAYNMDREKRNEEPDYSHGIFQTIGFKEFHKYLTSSSDTRSEEETKKLLDNSIHLMKERTHKYARKQLKWIRNRLLGAGNRQIPPVIKLDCTDKGTFQQNCVEPALQVVESVVTNGLSSLLQFATHPHVELILKAVTQNESEIRHIETNRNYLCEVCNKVLPGTKVYRAHMESRPHKRTLYESRIRQLKLAEEEREAKDAQLRSKTKSEIRIH